MSRIISFSWTTPALLAGVTGGTVRLLGAGAGRKHLAWEAPHAPFQTDIGTNA